MLKAKPLFKGMGAAIMIFGGLGFVVNWLHFSDALNVNTPFNAGLVLTGALLFSVAKKLLK